jgi:hypothetical protein
MENRPVRDLLITATETNDRHGVGIMLQRMFRDSSEFVCVRTTSLYGGEEPFGSSHHELCSTSLRTDQLRQHLEAIMRLYRIRRILCVPFYREEFMHAVLAKEITGSPLCTFIMDDQNIFAREVPDHRVRQLLNKSDLRLGISAELCAAYQAKYGLEFQLLPPLLERHELVVPNYWSPEANEPPRLAMVGNVWTATRFERLLSILRETGFHVDWFGRGPEASWLPGEPGTWEQSNLHCLGFLPEEDLIAALSSYLAVIIPSGSGGADDDNLAFTRLSLPSRLLFLHARTETPVLLLGSEQSAAGRFITRHGTGLCCNYDAHEVRAAVTELAKETTRRRAQSALRRIASALILPNAGEWLWQTLASGVGGPAPFRELFPPDYLNDSSLLAHVAPERPPLDITPPNLREAWTDERMVSFAFIREAHLDLARESGCHLPPLEDLELTHAGGAVASMILAHLLPEGGDVLFLGGALPYYLSHLPERFRFWRIADLAAWQEAGYSGDPGHVVGFTDGRAYPREFPQFDMIASVGWCGELPNDRHAHEGLSLYLSACVKPFGVNLHFFTAVLNTSSYWVSPTHGYLQTRFMAAREWPGRDELLDARDLFVMQQQAYDKYWATAVKRSYASFGQPLLQSLFWRAPAGSRI